MRNKNNSVFIGVSDFNGVTVEIFLFLQRTQRYYMNRDWGKGLC
jgi:hypothetical protein